MENSSFHGKLNKSISDDTGRTVYSSGCDCVSVHERSSRADKETNRKVIKEAELQPKVCLEPNPEKMTEGGREHR